MRQSVLLLSFALLSTAAARSQLCQEGGTLTGLVLDPSGAVNYAKEQRLIEDIREELRQGRRCQVYATFTGKHDVTGRLAEVLPAAVPDLRS